jgi:hypothetical protein
MYPNPQDVVPLPARPNLEQYKKQAKDLVKACRSGAADAFREWAARWPDHAGPIEQFARETLTSRDCALTAAQFVIARVHGFENWPKFSAHLDGLARAASLVSHFESAAEAIVTGDAATLERLLREHPGLIRARSTRGHRAMLLHYVAANGVENYRQRSPANAVRIAEILLDAGAEVDAEAEMYGGGCTTLGLAATSVYPEIAGVQDALMQTLIDHGAMIDRARGVGRTHSFVVGCLANGRAAAAEYLAARGASDLAARRRRRLDAVAGFFNADGTLKPLATFEQLGGFSGRASGRIAVVNFPRARRSRSALGTADKTDSTWPHWRLRRRRPAGRPPAAGPAAPSWWRAPASVPARVWRPAGSGRARPQPAWSPPERWSTLRGWTLTPRAHRSATGSTQTRACSRRFAANANIQGAPHQPRFDGRTIAV